MVKSSTIGKPESLMNDDVFKIKQKLKPKKELPELKRQGLKQNGGITYKEWKGYKIAKRTHTKGIVALWEYIYRKDEDVWIILHRYGRKESRNGQNKAKETPEQDLEVARNADHNRNENNGSNVVNNNNDGNVVFNNNIDGNNAADVIQTGIEIFGAIQNYQDDWRYDINNNFECMHDNVGYNIDDYDSNDNVNIFDPIEANNSPQNDQQHESTNEIQQCLNIIIEAFQNQHTYHNTGSDINEIWEAGDGILPDASSAVYRKLLRDSIAKKKFFNKPIKIYENLFQFKLASDEQMEDDEDENEDNEFNNGFNDESDDEIEEEIFSFDDLTRDGFQFIVDNKLIHLTSPAGTGKTMTIWQLAKSVDENFQRKLVPVAIKAEHYYHQIMLEDQFNFQSLPLEALVRASMHTAEVKNIEDQIIWCQNLAETIKKGTGVVLLIDALDEMKSRDREEFLRHIEFLTANLPGSINKDFNLVAIVASSRPGLTLPTYSEDQSWLKLELMEQENSEHVLQTLCVPDSAVYKKALELCEHYEFPKYLFWYQLLVIEAETMDTTSTLTASQFDFLGGLLLHSIRTTKDKKFSLDPDQSEMLSEDSTYLLLIAGLFAYISKVLQTTRIADLEHELSFLMPDVSFPRSIVDTRGSIIKKLLPVLQFCHCCSSCSEDSKDKFIVFDHQIVYDYLVASFIVKSITLKTHPSLTQKISASSSLAFNWQRYIKDTANYGSEWLQVLHLIADALPVGNFIENIKQCSQSEAEAWLSNIVNHPRCFDIEDPSFAYIKLIVSCLFNASRKSANSTKSSKQKNKKSKKESSNLDDNVTRLSFEVLLNLFKQPVIGQLIIEDICEIKSLSLLVTELTKRNLRDRFIQIFIDKFNAPSSEHRMPEELVTLAIRLFNIGDSEINSAIRDRLFDRLSSRCATEPVSSPITTAIHIFFKKIQDFGYLIDKLASGNELEVASALPLLLNFKRYRGMYRMQIDSLIMRIAQNPAVLPDESLLIPRLPAIHSWSDQVLLSGSFTWLEVKQTCPYFANKHFSLLTEALRYHYRSIKRKSVQTRDMAKHGHFDFLGDNPECAWLLRFQEIQRPDVTGEEKEQYLIWIYVAHLMLKARKAHRHLAELNFINSQIVPVHFEENTVEEALTVLKYNAVYISIPLAPRVRRNLARHRLHYATLVADNSLAQLLVLMDQLTSHHITLLIGYANDCFSLNNGTRKEWYPVIKYRTLEELLVTLCAEERAFQWTPETVVELWQFLGTDCYQFYLEEDSHEQVFPDLIQKMTAKWSIAEANACLAAILEIDLRSKLQYDAMRIIVQLV